MMKQLKYSITICPEELPASAPVLLRGTLERQFAIAGELGYDGVELQLRNPEKLSIEKLKDCCQQNGISVSAIATGLEYSLNKQSLLSDSAGERTRIIESLKRHIDLAAEVESPVILGCVRGNIPDGAENRIYWRRLDEGVYTLAAYAAERNVNLLMEAINSYVNNYLNSVSETAAYLKRLRLKNVKLHIDTHHMNIEDADFIAAVRQSEDYLGYVHFAGPNRGYPAPGRIPYPEIQSELRRMGYEGYISLECVPVPDGYTAAKRGLEYLKTI